MRGGFRRTAAISANDPRSRGAGARSRRRSGFACRKSHDGTDGRVPVRHSADRRQCVPRCLCAARGPGSGPSLWPSATFRARIGAIVPAMTAASRTAWPGQIRPIHQRLARIRALPLLFEAPASHKPASRDRSGPRDARGVRPGPPSLPARTCSLTVRGWKTCPAAHAVPPCEFIRARTAEKPLQKRERSRAGRQGDRHRGRHRAVSDVQLERRSASRQGRLCQPSVSRPECRRCDRPPLTSIVD